MTARQPFGKLGRPVGRRRILGGGAALSLGGVAALLAACGSDSKSASSGAGSSGASAPAAANTAAGSAPVAAAGTPRRGGRIGWTFLNSPNYNPVVNWAEAQNLSGSHVYDRLISSREDEKRYNLEAAASVETPDPLTLVFKLKPTLKTHNVAPVNGRNLKAADVVATQKYVANVPNPYDANFQKNYLASAEAPDDTTVVFKLKRQNAYVFGSQMLGLNTSQVIIPTEMLDKDLATTPPVGSGPWLLADHQIDSRYLFKRFDGWREQGKPYADEHELFKMNDPVPMESAFRAGTLHVTTSAINGPSSERIAKEMGTKANLIQKTGVGPVAFWMNMEKDYPWQKDIRVRQAFWRLMNRQQILNLAYQSKGKLPTGLVPAGLTAYQLDAKDTDEYQKTDPREAKQLLDAAGWDYNSEWEITQRDAPANLQMAEVFQQQAAQIGVKLRIGRYPFQEWLPNLMGQRRYQIVLEASPGDETPGRTLRFLHTTTNNQNSGFGLHDLALDALIEKSEETLDPQESIKLVKQIQLEALKLYSSSRLILTPDVIVLLAGNLKDWYVAAAGVLVYRTEAWLSA